MFAAGETTVSAVDVGPAFCSNKLVGLFVGMASLARPRKSPDAPPTAVPVIAPAAPASSTRDARSGAASPPATIGASAPVTNSCPASVRPSATVPRAPSLRPNAPRCPAALSLVVPAVTAGSLLPMYRVKSKNSGRLSSAAYGAAASKAA